MDAELVTLFRSMWYLCILSGFLSGPSRIADWQRAALMRIAEHTPCLLQGAGDDFVETDLRFNPILGRTNYTVVRQRLLKYDLTSRSLPTPFAPSLLHSSPLKRGRSARCQRPRLCSSSPPSSSSRSGPRQDGRRRCSRTSTTRASTPDRSSPCSPRLPTRFVCSERRDSLTILPGQRHVCHLLQRARHPTRDQPVHLPRGSGDLAPVRSPVRACAIRLNSLPQRLDHELPLAPLRGQRRERPPRATYGPAPGLPGRVHGRGAWLSLCC